MVGRGVDEDSGVENAIRIAALESTVAVFEGVAVTTANAGTLDPVLVAVAVLLDRLMPTTTPTAMITTARQIAPTTTGRLERADEVACRGATPS